MSVGLAFFLSSVLFALVMLYGVTKDRWSWRQIARRSALTFVTLMVVTGAVIVSLYFWNQLPAVISPQTEYEGLRLGIGSDEVMYIKGYPPTVMEEMEGMWRGRGIDTFMLGKGEHVQDYRRWVYQDSSMNAILIAFNAEKTAVVAIACSSYGLKRTCPSIGGVADTENEQEVIRKLGTPGTSRITDGTKIMSYPNVGIELWLDRERVRGLGIYDRKYKGRTS